MKMLKINLIIILLINIVEHGLCYKSMVHEGYNRRMTEDERHKVLKDLVDSQSGLDPPCVVDPNPTEDPSEFPKIPNSFITDVEFSIIKDGLLTQQRAITGKEMFHGGLNAGVVQYQLGEGLVVSRPFDKEEKVHYNIDNDEALNVVQNSGCTDEGSEDCHPYTKCTSMNIEEASYKLQELFGFVNFNGVAGFLGASGILEFGPQFHYVHQSDEECRGMRCQKFHTCLSNPEENATVSITYFWSDPEWNMEATHVQVPVAVDIAATGKYGGVFNKKLHHRYDFYDFMYNAEPNPEVLYPPSNVFCHGRNTSYELPSLPPTFSYVSETVTSFEISTPEGNLTDKIDFDTVYPQMEVYDWKKKIAQIEFVPLLITGEEKRHEHKTVRIQDFVQGLSYNIKPGLQQCNISIIENITSISDVIVGKNGSVSMLNPWIFLNMDEPMQYSGEHFVRGQTVDSWVGVKRSIIPFLNETYVAYFASSTFDDNLKMKSSSKKTQSNSRIKSRDSHLVRMERHLTIGSGPHTIINMYDFLTRPPVTHKLDVSSCMSSSDMSNYIITLQSNALHVVKYQRENLKYAVQETLAVVANISALRVNRLVLEENDEIKVLFTLLEAPELIGDSTTAVESTMAESVNKITSAVNNNNLRINVILDPSSGNEDNTAVTVRALPNTMIKVTRNGNNYWFEIPKQYNSGDMAGIAVGMVITGILVGVLVNIVIRKKSGLKKFSDIFPMKRLSRSKETGTSEA